MLSHRCVVSSAAAIAVTAIALIGLPAHASDGEEVGSIWDSYRQDIADGRLDLAATRTDPAAPGHSAHPGTAHHTGSHANPAVGIDVLPPERSPFERCLEDWRLMLRCIDAVANGEPVPETDAGTAASPAITITDLASFAPAPASIAGEPDNLGVAGLPTNFTAGAAVHTRDGDLFGYAVTARFTPTAFTFHYGDATTKTTSTAGQTWEALHLPQFTATDTSHTYTERGTYHARVDTAYTAEIDLGTGYIPVSGTLTITGATQDIRIFEARTALVAHTCTETPAAPGC